MLIVETSFVCTITFSSTKHEKTIKCCSKKKFLSEKSRKQNKPRIFPFKFSTNKILLQSAVGVFALGFIDAGYSGDWSRIGVISKHTEDLLKLTAFFVVPFCLFLIFSFSEKVEK
ncbi:unnamed protein product [Fraxinus pennsylvanica]|uniref:DUF7887 domain-containing protein n=1 Tax=Fraxinus pennsylvanica TaxID=56036 RepID=A0AAD2AAX0_9LAMI|nr:unnamed protein product [Fraxinus pennsylvanica]